MKTSVACLGCIAVALAANSAMGAPTWYAYDGKYYALSETSGDWTQTEAEAVKLGGHLVAIDSAQENAWLLSTFPQSAFIGLYQTSKDDEPAGNWAWSSGDPVAYTNWRPGQPDDYLGQNEYGQINVGSVDGLWDDVDVIGFPEDQTYEGIMEVADLTWFTYQGHKYALTRTTGDWADLEAEAQVFGGHLATINSADENAWLLSTFPQNSLFIGLYQPDGSSEPDGGWSWVSGEPVTYLNWEPGQPDGFMAEDNYAMMNIGSLNGQWHDVGPTGWPLGSAYQGIIEVPEPTTSILILLGAALGLRRKAR
ncbi:MAG: PEP-CTERM sorting domain-containing protein [Phycisphaerae bacterium]|nr:PEP-CTERM sorting domain-containing protein [Phycisphaerae bacterium]